MLGRIKDLLHDSFFYGASKFLGQLVSFLLVPLYTRYLTPSDYGLTTILGIFSLVIGLVANLGLESSIYNYLGTRGTENRKAIDTASFLVLICSLGCLLLCMIFNRSISSALLGDNYDFLLILLSTLIGFFSSLSTIPLTVLRLERRVKVVSLSTLINVFGSIIFTLIFLFVLHLGVTGVVLGNLVGTLLSLIFLMTSVPLPKFINWDKAILNDLLKLSLYLFPNKLFAFGMPYYSQFMLSRNLDLTSLGLYAIAWKFCTPFSLIMNTFSQSWGPYKFQVFKEDEDPKAFFRSFFSLFIGLVCFCYMTTSLLGDDLIALMTTKDFYSAGKYLYALALIPLANALYFMMTTGYEFSKSQRMRPFVTLAGLVAVILFSTFLIKDFGIAGAAMAIAAGWLTMAISTYYFSFKIYPIRYEWGKVVILLIISLSITFFRDVFNPHFVIDCLFLVAFVVILIIMFPKLRKARNFLTYLKMKR